MTRRDTGAAVGLYVVVLGVYALRTAASMRGPLTGEEASLSFLYVLAVPQRLEYSIYATNFAGHLFFWVASHLDPDLGLFYGRVAKAVFLALLAPLTFLVLRRRLGCRPLPAIAGAACATLLPGVAVFSWLATENGLEAVWGLAALFVVTSERRWWPLGLVLAGVAVSTYSSGLAWAATAGVVALVRTARTPRAAWAVAGAGLGGAAVVLFPWLWWTNGGVIVSGGGAFDPSWRRGGELLGLLARDGSSYYYFDDLPLLGAWPVAVLGAVALAVVCARRPAVTWPYAFLTLVTVGLYLVSGNITGSRRVIALTVVVGLAAGVAVDLVPRPLPRRTAAAVLVAGALVGAVLGTLRWGADDRGAVALPVDFPFPLDGAPSQQVVLDRLDADLRSGRTTADRVAERYDMRTLAVLVVLAERHGRTPPLAPGDVTRVYAGSALCRQLDGPACARLAGS